MAYIVPDPNGVDDTATIVALQAAMRASAEAGERTTYILGDGVYRTSETLDLSFQGDTRVLAHLGPNSESEPLVGLRGRGRRMTTITQINNTKPVVRIATTGGNVRDLLMENVCLSGGSYGLDLERGAYCLFRNVVFDKQAVAGYRANIGVYDFVDCWWVHGQLIGDAVSATVQHHRDRFGEDMGGFKFESAFVVLNDCAGHNLSCKGSDRPVGEQAWLDLGGGASAQINGGRYLFKSTNSGDAIFRTNYTREIIVSDAMFVIGDMPSAIINRSNHSGTWPYPPLIWRGGLIKSWAAASFQFYNQIDDISARSHKNATIDTTIAVRQPDSFSWGDAFLAAGNSVERSNVTLNND